ncbi:putative ribonuclease H-like domain-containing protein [Tanacetum coccineum]
MQNELLQFKLQKVWTLVDLPYDMRAIRTKWVYRNKKDERGIVTRNKARLVAQGYTQAEGIDYDEVFALVVRIEAIRLFLAYASFKDFIVYQMDMKSAFMYGKIEEEVYVCQPPGLEDPKFLDRVYKVEKALYGLHQAYGSTSSSYSIGIPEIPNSELTFFPLGQQVTIRKDADVDFSIRSKTMSTPKLGLWYPKDSPFDLEAYTDSDYVGASLDWKSTTGVDETAIKEWEDKMERAATTASSLEAEEDSGNINKTQSMATLNESFPQGTGSGSHHRCQDTTLEVQKLKLERELVKIKIHDGNAFWNEIGVNAGVSKLMLLSINLLLPVLVHAARHSLTTVRHKLMLPGITYYY